MASLANAMRMGICHNSWIILRFPQFRGRIRYHSVGTLYSMTLNPQLKTFVGLRASLDDPRVVHVLGGGLAFALYQLVLAFALQALGSVRDANLLPLELLVFALLGTCLYLYSTVSAARSQVLSPVNLRADEERKLYSARIAAHLSKKLAAFCQGIDHSLAAIMFFTRAQLGRKVSPQLERDLREVMERIDQVQLLVSEMQRSVREVDSIDSRDALRAVDNDNLEPMPSIPIPDSVDEYQGAQGLFSLRKTARKVIVLPITVSYVGEESELRFHTYTLNLCEEGACIVFSGNDLGSQSDIGIQMPEEFEAKARIRWIQPPRENSFRLAGIEFLDRRVKMAVL